MAPSVVKSVHYTSGSVKELQLNFYTELNLEAGTFHFGHNATIYFCHRPGRWHKRPNFKFLYFFSTGHDTTASAICWTLYNLARYAQYQDKCRQEVMDLMQGRDGHEIEWSENKRLHTGQLNTPAYTSALKGTGCSCTDSCLDVKGGSVQPSLHHHVHQRESQAPLACTGRNQEVHPGRPTARGSHSARG